jgi:hypothetical protein
MALLLKNMLVDAKKDRFKEIPQFLPKIAENGVYNIVPWSQFDKSDINYCQTKLRVNNIF